MWKNLWADPVWSKVIAAAIIAALSGLGTSLVRATGANPRQQALTAIASALEVTLVWYLVLRIKRRRRLRASLAVAIDDAFPHVPVVSLDLHNPSGKAVWVAAVEFETKDQWDIPDPDQEGFTVPVVPLLPRPSTVIKLAPQRGSLAAWALGLRVPPRSSSRASLRLATDHSPAYGFGVFPYYIGCTLVYGKNSYRLPLPDLLVSLHGATPLGMVQSRGAGFVMDPGEMQHRANAALSKITEDVICPTEVLTVLKHVAGALAARRD